MTVGFDDHIKEDQSGMGGAGLPAASAVDEGVSQEEEPLPPPRSELPTLPDRPNSEPPRLGVGGQPATEPRGSGSFELPPLERLERRLLEVVADSERAPRPATEAPPAAAPADLDSPAARLDAQALWSEFISGVPTPRAPVADVAVPPPPLDGGLRRPGAVAAIARFAAEALRESSASRAGCTPPPPLADAVDDDRTDPASPTARRLSERPPRWEAAPPAAPPPAESASPPPVSLSLSPTSFDGTAPGTTSAVLRPSRGGAAWSVVGLVALASFGAGLTLLGLGRWMLGAGTDGAHAPVPRGFERGAAPAAVVSGFDLHAAERALEAAAAACGGPSGLGSARVRVTFAAPSGKATEVTIDGGSQAGAGACVAQALRAAVVPPFTGGPVTVERSVALR